MEVADPKRSELWKHWKETFDSCLYDLSFDTDDIKNLPNNLVKCCNMFATIKLVTPWRDVAYLEKNYVLGLCGGLIS